MTGAEIVVTGALKPCPFCGGEAKYEAEGEWQYYDAWSVECMKCGASVSGNADMRVSGACAKSEAIAAWNTRAIEDAALEVLREVEGALRWYHRQGRDCRKVTGEGEKARFALDNDGGERARQALALLHAHIARADQRGRGDGGRPY